MGRDLRMAKVKQKVSGCFRTIKYAEAYCWISSYFQTIENKGYKPLITIQMVLAGRINDVGCLVTAGISNRILILK